MMKMKKNAMFSCAFNNINGEREDAFVANPNGHKE